MSLVNENIKFLRKLNQLTQQQLADKLGIKRSLLGAYEEGRAEPGLPVIREASKLFDVSVDALVSVQIISEEILKEVRTTAMQAGNVRILSIAVDRNDREIIKMVSAKAAAGYMNGYADPEYVAELPEVQIPGFVNGTYRAFEIKGDSMLPLPTGTTIIGEYVEGIKDIRFGKTYIIVTKEDGIIYKRVYDSGEDELLLKSDNLVYEPYTIPVKEILEIWEAKAFISKELPDPDSSVDKLTGLLGELQEEIKRLKK